jgi:hypothetical protein
MTSNYFFLINSTGPEVGTVPQDKVALGQIDLNAVHNKKLFEPTDPTLELNYIQLADKAKLTDFICSGILGRDGFLISDKACEILQKHALCAYQIIPAVLEFKNKKLHNYQWLHFAEDNTREMIFEESVLMTFKYINIDIPGWDYDYQRFTVSNHDELLKFYAQKSGVRSVTAEKVTLKKKLAERDMLVLRGFVHLVIVTQRLKEALEKNKLNGMEFKAVPFAVQFA